MTAIGPAPDKIKSAKDRTKTWLQDVYKKELGRDLGDEGEKYWTADIHDRGQTEEQVLANIRRSDEYKNYQRGRDDERGIGIFPIIPGDPTQPGPKKPKPETETLYSERVSSRFQLFFQNVAFPFHSWRRLLNIVT